LHDLSHLCLLISFCPSVQCFCFDLILHLGLLGALEILQVACSPAGHTFASGSCDKRVKIWDARTRQPLASFDDLGDQVWSVAYSPDGRNVVAAFEDGAISVYELQSSSM
jgi:WD40 repeat protein